MPTYYVKLRTATQPIEITADENPENGEYVGNAHTHIIFHRNGHEVARFVAGQVEAWWADADEDAVVI